MPTLPDPSDSSHTKATPRGAVVPASPSEASARVAEGRPGGAFMAALVAIGVLAIVVPPLAVPGAVLTLILALAFPSPSGKIHRFGQVTIAVAAFGCLAGLGRFAISKAMLGIVESGQSSAAKSALWRLREIVIAEDALRKNAAWDPDGDHVGSAGLIGALTGTAALRPGAPRGTPLLNYAFRGSVETAIGEASRVEGYLVIVCLPQPGGGGFTAREGASVDDELAERRYLAYAWPTELSPGMTTAFFADEHERILVLDPPRGAPAPYLGVARPPACNAATGGDGLDWKPWKNKKAREKLPGYTE